MDLTDLRMHYVQLDLVVHFSVTLLLVFAELLDSASNLLRDDVVCASETRTVTSSVVTWAPSPMRANECVLRVSQRVGHLVARHALEGVRRRSAHLENFVVHKDTTFLT